eukprot:352740-Chlamydomonas_euryale.AAC.1
MRRAQCAMHRLTLHVLQTMPHAPCPMPHAPHAVCHAICSMRRQAGHKAGLPPCSPAQQTHHVTAFDPPDRLKSSRPLQIHPTALDPPDRCRSTRPLQILPSQSTAVGHMPAF